MESTGPFLPKHVPKSPKIKTVGDRFIPARPAQRLSFPLSTLKATEEEDSLYVKILQNELLGEKSPSKSSVLSFKTDNKGSLSSPFHSTALSETSQKLLTSPQKIPRKIPKTPYKILQVPSIQDDFYLNLVDWSCNNIIAVGLLNNAYLWNASTCQQTKLMDFEDNNVASVCWLEKGKTLAVGSQRGMIEVWDAETKKLLHEFSGHRQRVGALAWSDESGLLASGSRDHTILFHDLRSGEDYIQKMVGHRQEVCGMKWSPDGKWLASGGNDNKLFIWDSAMASSSTFPVNEGTAAVCKFSDHTAAVKAVAWSPHQRGTVASGGGTADRTIRIWNVLSGDAVSHMDTGSQVCNLAWSKNVNEIVSTHGYSQNQIMVWSQSHNNLVPIATLMGHLTRVLYLSVSPDGGSIVTGAGDETLRFWNVFPSASSFSATSSPSSPCKLSPEKLR